MKVQATWCILLVFHTTFAQLKINYDMLAAKHRQTCANLALEPYFDIQQVIGKTWRIYYTWNIVMETKCVDITFRNATNAIVSRIYNDMNEYLEEQPTWDAATLLINIGPSKHEMLMFADQGSAGYFTGVANVVRRANFSPGRKSVPLMRLYLKQLYQGKYLVLADCSIGVVSLSTHDMPPYRAEIADLVTQLNLGPGTHVCLTDKKKDEIVGVFNE